ncbi:MAG: 30S ribosomal protein S4e [Candidatus Nanoarchaeia archaeon]|nr:30S ribosomal protein S4e [Candidatus Haiyanarchaeum thermophilum]MCW1303111.1 30S ribosomal protein S4e [Candidatus Haiyanarchaeum thermophilum]MCW1303776.1 30S ribosomal protein S4e [Candidatus Haiyanarchaeum thermophilum]MCW1306609.1 30S ribosomal protein S4e [Candidatus Haiyanarchaeum thermophilum]MCW1307021.1 30S ribosomal protein S4e [Candidatus Haiyanarchaeum thermophilum]
MKRHLKRLSAPSTWIIERKTYKFTVRPSPGRHKLERCMPLLLILRDILKLVKNAREGKRILNAGEVLVDCVPRKDYKFPVGFMDLLEIPKLKLIYRIGIDRKRRIKLIEIPEGERNLKICKIIGKRRLKGRRLQLNLHDGRNVLVDYNLSKLYHTQSSLLLQLPSQQIVKYIPLEEGSLVLVLGGEHSGKLARVEGISGKSLNLRDEEGKSFTASIENVIAVGKEKPEVKCV